MAFKKIKHSTQKGFTLMELIVVIALIAILTVLILFNSGRLNSAILVSNTAYEIGLIVRESQVAGLGVKAANNSGLSGPQIFTSSHGVHVDLAEPTKVILFADSGLKNGIYDASNSEMTQEYIFGNKRSGTILSMCGKLVNSSGDCINGNTSFTPVASADIVFTRPNPEAFFKIRRVPNGAVEEHIGALIINIGFANDVCRSITIEKTGAVQIDSEYCPPIQ